MVQLGGLLLVAALAALGTGAFDALLRSSTGVDVREAVSGLGLPFFLQLNVFTLLAAAVFIYSLWPRKPKVYVLDFAVFSPPARCASRSARGGASDWGDLAKARRSSPSAVVSTIVRALRRIKRLISHLGQQHQPPIMTPHLRHGKSQAPSSVQHQDRCCLLCSAAGGSSVLRSGPWRSAMASCCLSTLTFWRRLPSGEGEAGLG